MVEKDLLSDWCELGVPYANISSAHLANRFFRWSGKQLAVWARTIGLVGLSALVTTYLWVRCEPFCGFLWSPQNGCAHTTP